MTANQNDEERDILEFLDNLIIVPINEAIERKAIEVHMGLNRINKTLEKHNQITLARLDAMPKPENKLIRILKAFVLVAGSLAILNSADIIRNWITGG